MGFISGLFIRILKLIFYLIIIAAFVVLIPNLPPYTKFTSIQVEPSQPRVGALAPNYHLNNAEKLYEDKLLGPEAFQIWNGEVYTGLSTGEIVKVSPGGHVTFVTKIGQPCSLVQEHICGRPLGFVIDERNKFLYVADAYHGIWKVNLVTDNKQLLVSPQVEINGKSPKLFNSVALDNKGDLYWTDSSSDFQLRDGVLAVLADPTGRLLHYNFAKNESKVLLDELWFPNGLIISPDNSYLLVAESSKYRIIKYYIKGEKKGTSEVFLAGIPGIPDNIRALPDGSGVLVSLYNVFDDEHPLLLKSMAAAPLARKLVARIIRLIEIPFEFLQSQFPNYIFENIVHTIGSFGSVANLSPGLSGLIQIDWNGNIVASYYNTDKSVYHISDAVVVNNKLYIACPHLQNFIGAVPAPPQLIKAFTTQEIPKQKPVVETKRDENKPNIKNKVQESKTTTPPPPKSTTTKSKAATPPSTKSTTTRTTENAKTTTPQPPKSAPTQTPTPKQSTENVRQNAPKQAEPKVSPKDSEKIKQKETLAPSSKPKEAENKPKTIVEEKPRAEIQRETPKVVTKEADVKSKAALKDTKANEVPKETDKETKKLPKQTEQTPKFEQTKTVDQKATVPEKQESHTKPVTKETEVKPKIIKEKVGGNTETVPKESSASPESENKNKDKVKPTNTGKPKKSEKESAKKAPERAPNLIPIEEEIPSDTVKPSKETLKVIKKNGPQEIPNPNL